MKEISFSIIVPIYNTKSIFLIDCFESILNVNYDNYEVILIDDGSNTQTKEIIELYKEKLNATVIHQTNSGISASRINGLNIAKGDYIFFLDSDDIVDKEGLNRLNEIINKNDSDVIVYVPPRFIESINNIIPNNKYFDEGVISKDKAVEELIKLHINGVGDKFAKRTLYKDMYKFIDTSIINGEDLQQSTYLILNAKSLYYTEQYIEYYRINNEPRDYYNIRNINDINYLIPTYNMVFIETNKYNKLLPFYKKAAINDVINMVFLIGSSKLKYKEKIFLLNKLQKQEIVKLLCSIKCNISFLSMFVFKLFVYKLYLPIIILGKIYMLNKKPGVAFGNN